MTKPFAPIASPAPEIFCREDGSSIACHRGVGRTPGVVFLTGYMSDMSGQKAVRLEECCRARRLLELELERPLAKREMRLYSNPSHSVAFFGDARSLDSEFALPK